MTTTLQTTRESVKCVRAERNKKRAGTSFSIGTSFLKENHEIIEGHVIDRIQRQQLLCCFRVVAYIVRKEFSKEITVLPGFWVMAKGGGNL
jgi:hypothetical protein